MSVENEYMDDIISMVISSHITQDTKLADYHVESITPLALDIIPIVDEYRVIILSLNRVVFSNINNPTNGMLIKYISVKRNIQIHPVTDYQSDNIKEMEEQLKHDDIALKKHYSMLETITYIEKG